MKHNKKIPKSFQSILWSVSVDKLELEEDKNYIIHQILARGNLDTIKWLFNAYSKNEIKRVFETAPRKVYDARTFNFVKDYVLDLKNRRIASSKYVTTIY